MIAVQKNFVFAKVSHSPGTCAAWVFGPSSPRSAKDGMRAESPDLSLLCSPPRSGCCRARSMSCCGIRAWRSANSSAFPLLAGVLLAIGRPALGPIWRGVLKVQMISMLAVFGWLYSVAPVRLCTSYLQSDQEQLGRALCVLAGALALAWALPWMFGSDNAAVGASGR